MKYYIGMDGGGTKTHCALTDENMNIVHECTGGPSTFLLQGTDAVAETLFALIDECRSKAGIKFEDIEAAALGTSGAGRRSDAETMENAFLEYCKSKNADIKKFHVNSDARAALEGAFSGKPGSILISGTGTIMFGKDSKGNIQRVGGFGRFIGDEGSGYMLGRKGCMAAAKAFDGRGSYTLIKDLLAEKHGIDDPSVLITEIYKKNFDIAQVARLVTEAAEKEDYISRQIVKDEVQELVLHINAMYKALNEKVMRLSLIGSTITTDNYFARAFRDEVESMLPGVELVKPENPPYIGAALLAKEL